MRWRLACLALLGCLLATNAWAGPISLTTSVGNGTSPGLGKIVTGTSGATTFTVSSAGAVSSSGGAIRLLGNASVTTPTLTITCHDGTGSNTCVSHSSSVTVTLASSSSSGGRAGSITGITGSLFSGTAAVTNTSNTVVTITPTGGHMTNGQQIEIRLGMSIQINNTGAGLGAQTVFSYTLNTNAS